MLLPDNESLVDVLVIIYYNWKYSQKLAKLAAAEVVQSNIITMIFHHSQLAVGCDVSYRSFN